MKTIEVPNRIVSMLHAVRVFAVSIVIWGLVLLLVRNVATGLRTGKIRYAGNSTARRDARPVVYWLIVLFNLFFAGLCVYVWFAVVA